MLYLDASAIVKLIVDEPGSSELRSFLTDAGPRVTSIVSLVETLRAVERVAPAARATTSAVLARFAIIQLDATLARRAAILAPPPLRSLDAIHLASAVELGSELQGFLTYDRRLAEAAREAGMSVASPGVDAQ